LEGVQVGKMGVAQAVEMFQKYSKFSRDDAVLQDDVPVVVKDSGSCALAATLAATYVRRLQSNIKAYLLCQSKGSDSGSCFYAGLKAWCINTSIAC
jgi:hypothetical protein